MNVILGLVISMVALTIIIGAFDKAPTFAKKAFNNYTSFLNGGVGKKVFYWALPIFLFVFTSTIGGGLLFLAALMGFFNQKKNAPVSGGSTTGLE